MFRQIAALALFTVQVSTVAAQDVRDIEPAWRVVTRDAAPARSGPDGVYYTVAELKAGRVVRVDGEGGGYARVRYPEGFTAMVPADEVRVVNETRVELTKASGLRAPSELLGLSGSWMAVFDPALPVGTALEVKETVKNKAGDVVGYRVVPPAPPAAPSHARFYVTLDALRDATAAEVTAHLGGRTDETPAARPQIEERPAQPQTQPQTQPQNQAEPQPTTPPTTEPQGQSETQTEQPAETTEQPAEPAPRPSLLPAGLEELEASFAAARTQPAEELDQALDELLAEFQRTRAATDDDRLQWQLDQRIEWLKLRIETRDQRRAIRSALAQADERAQALQREVDDWQKSRAFQLVGRLVQSSVYNGERLPRMYRVQAVSSLDGTPRTLGYLMPDESLDQMLGSVVGIVGESRFDPQLRLMVIRPDRVEVMQN